MNSNSKPTFCFAGVRLEALQTIRRYGEVTSIITKADSWVHQYCLKTGQPVELIDKNKRENVWKCLVRQKAEYVFSAGFPFIIPENILQCGRKFINSHPALLPKYRGYSPIKEAHDNGEPFMGVTVHWLTAELDAGPVIHQERVWVEGLNLAQIYEQLFSVVEPFVISKALEQILKD